MMNTLSVTRRKSIAWVGILMVLVILVIVQTREKREKRDYIPTNRIQSVIQAQLCHGCKYTSSNEKRIPKIIHQIWNEDIVPTEFVENIKSFIKYNGYPEWDYYFWTLDIGREFIKQKFPKLLKIYDGSDIFTKPDILRILVIYHYGGVYFDLDVLNIRPLDRFVDSHECVLSGALPEYFVAYDWIVDYRHVNNAIMLCRPDHPFFKHLVSHTEDRSNKCLSNGTCPRPEFPHPLLVYLTDNGLNKSIPDIVHYSFFEPMYDLTITHLMNDRCSGTPYTLLEPAKRKICDDWRMLGEDKRMTFEHSYTVHTWYHTGINKVTRNPKNKISNIVPHVKIYNTLLGDHTGVV